MRSVGLPRMHLYSSYFQAISKNTIISFTNFFLRSKNTFKAMTMKLSATELLDILQSFMLWVPSSKLSDMCIGIDKMCTFKHWKAGRQQKCFFKVVYLAAFCFFFLYLMLLLCRTLTTKVNLCPTMLCNSWFQISLSSSYLHQWKQCTIRSNL